MNKHILIFNKKTRKSVCCSTVYKDTPIEALLIDDTLDAIEVAEPIYEDCIVDKNNIPVFTKHTPENLNLATQVRNKRNRLLAACDWTQLPDATVDQNKWAKYRMQLKAVPEQKGFPDKVNWPVPPNEKE